MDILYVSHNYESVQQHLYESLKKIVTNMYLAYYPLTESLSRTKLTNGATCFNSIIKVKGFIFYKLYLQRISKKCISYYKNTRLDFVHGNMLFCDGYICRKIAKEKKINFCVSVRDTDINSKFLWRIPWLKSMGLKTLEEASAVIFLSPKYKDKLLNKVPKEYIDIINSKSQIIPNGVDDFFISNSMTKKIDDLNGQRLRLIYVGKLSKRKNIETTMAACEILIKQGIQVEFNIVGPIIDKEYESLINNCPYIKYHGKCEKEQVLEHLRNSDIFVMPSHTETFGLVYLEAMSQGLPVIYTKNQGFDGMFDDGDVGFSVDDNSPDEVANRIIMIRNDYAEISKRATKLSSDCSWDRTATQLLNLYRTFS